MAERHSSTWRKHGYYPGDWVRPRDNPGDWIPIVDVFELFTGRRAANRQGVYELYDAPVGIQLKLEEALKSAPLEFAGMEWNTGGLGPPVRGWNEGGRYHMLYRAGGGICYAVSEDGYQWTGPELGLIKSDGSRKNNLVISVGGDMFKAVFEDPTAPPEERFKGMGCEGGLFDPDTDEEVRGEEAQRRWVAQEYEASAYKGPRIDLRGWVIGWTSPDRIHWKRIEEPLGNFPMDGGISAGYDPHSGTYFAYCRVHGLPPGESSGIGTGAPEVDVVRRAVGLSRTRDFRHWTPPKLVLFPDAQDDLGLSFYGADYFPYPGRSDLHCMAVQAYHQITDHTDSQIAFSRDGLFWYRPERKAIIPLGPPGSGDDGMVQTWGSGLVELPDGYWGCLYGGNSGLHNMPRDEKKPPRPRQIQWARWQPHRFCGIEAENEGRFTIPTIVRTRNELRLNYRCKPGGWVSVELLHNIPSRVHPDVDPVSGLTFEDSDRLAGDSLDQVVTWQGRSDISSTGDMVAIRVRMFQAKLFAYLV